MTRIRGEKVLLREYSWDDLRDMRKWAVDAEATRWLGPGFLRPQTFEQTESYLRSVLEGNAGGVNYAIADPETDRYLGQINLTKIDTQARRAELAIVLCPDARGKGFAREALALMLECAFDTWNMNRVYLSVDAENERAVRLYKACGFQTEGRLREDRFWGGAYHDTLQMGVLRRDWEAGRGSL